MRTPVDSVSIGSDGIEPAVDHIQLVLLALDNPHTVLKCYYSAMYRHLFIITLALLLPLPAGAVEPLHLAPKASKSVAGTGLYKPKANSAPVLKTNWTRHKESGGLLADRPSVSGQQEKRPETSPTRFIDAQPKFWTDQGESWRKTPASSITES